MLELVDAGIDHPRGGAPLLAGAHLKVVRGEVVLIVAAAGVGTSRLVAAAMGEAPLARGRLEILGRDVSRLRRSSLRLLRRRIGVVPQDLCLLGDRSAQLNVVLPLEIDGVPRSISVLRAAQIAGVADFVARHPQGFDLDVGVVTGGGYLDVDVAAGTDPPVAQRRQPTRLDQLHLHSPVLPVPLLICGRITNDVLISKLDPDFCRHVRQLSDILDGEMPAARLFGDLVQEARTGQFLSRPPSR